MIIGLVGTFFIDICGLVAICVLIYHAVMEKQNK